MKRLKRALVMLLSMVMVLMASLPVMASEASDTRQRGEVTITIENQDNGSVDLLEHTFVAYQIFKGTQQTDPTKSPNKDGKIVDRLGDVEWGNDVKGADLLTALHAVTNKDLGISGTDVVPTVSPFADDTTAKDVSETLSEIAALDASVAQRALDEIAKIAMDYVVKPGTMTMVFQSSEGRVVYDNLPMGYYLILDETDDATLEDDDARNAAIFQMTTDIVIRIKTSKPSVDKVIVEGDNEVKSNDVAIGKDVNFKITTRVPDMSHFRTYKFVVADQLSRGLTYNEGSLKINVYPIDAEGNVDYSATPALLTAYAEGLGEYDYKLKSPSEPALTGEYEGGTNLRIVFHDFYNKYLNKAGYGIVIEYSAKLNVDAQIGSKANPNKVNLEYWNNPNKKGSGDPDDDDFKEDDPKGISPESTTYTFTTGLRMTKVDAEDDSITLDGAKFTVRGKVLNTETVVGWNFREQNADTDAGKEVYYKLNDGTYTTDAPNGDEKHDANYESTEVKYVREAVKGTVESAEDPADEFEVLLTVNEDGVLEVAGLPAGTYVITEVVAPLGYNLLTDNIVVEINEPKVTIHEDGTYDCVWSATLQQDKEAAAGSMYFASDLEGFWGGFAFKVMNSQGALLPRTGGIGTTIFYVVGCLLVVVAGVLLVVKMRAGRNED